MRRGASLVFLAGVVTLAPIAAGACGSGSGSGAATSDGGASNDALASDAPNAADGSGGGNGSGDAGEGGGGPSGVGLVPGNYSDFGDAMKWSFHAVTGVNLHGGTFDGRFVYFAPGYPGATLLRFDTTGAGFDVASAWTTLNMGVALVDAGSAGFVGGGGASFDGRYLYLSGGGVSDGYVMRYDTTATLSDPASWASFDVATAAPSTKGLGGSTFDGRYIYFVEAGGYEMTHVVRYDTKASFTDPAAWKDWRSFHLGTLMQSANTGVVFDGRYVYFVPAGSSVVRYDTTIDFASDNAWSLVGVPDLQYFGGAFDGRHVYFVPNLDPNGGAGYSGGVARWDPFMTTMTQLDGFDTTTVSMKAKGFDGAGYDGRYLYLMPFYNGANSGLVARVDTAADFAAAASWSTVDLTTMNADAASFAGSIFDGRYLYLVPSQAKVVARFDARDKSQLPPLPFFHGSFF